jgi:4-methylaminobutanoate oxidase (formaldehyde-forming)
VVRDPDRLFYCREDVGAFLIGAFEGNPKAWAVEGVPWAFTQELLNPEWELFEPVLEAAIERIPLLAEAEAIELVNGPDAFTPDGHYALGPVPGLRGFYVAAGGSINGIAGAGGVGKLIAEWILEGAPSIDTHEMNIRRFGAHLTPGDYLTEHCREVYRYYYRLRYPEDENEWGRPLRTSPFFPRLQNLRAVFGEKNGWERVNYFGSSGTWRQAGADQKRWGWKRAEHFDRVGLEARAVREAAGIIDMTSFGKIDVRGPGAMGFLQHLAAGNLDRPVGSVTYTQFLNTKGGIESDVTVTRMTEEFFRIVSGTAFASNDLGWIRMHLPDDGSVTVKEVTEDWACLSLCGPKARTILEAVTDDDLSNAGFAYMTARSIDIAGIPLWAQRISYTGELGWELYMVPEHALAVWDAVLTAGGPLGLRPFGYKALDSLRIEKGYLYWSADITPEDTPLEAGLGFAVALDKKDFIGRNALLRLREDGTANVLRALLMDAGGNLYGGESVYDGNVLVNRVRTGNHGYTVGKDIGLVYLPRRLARPGTRLSVEVLGERLAAEVAALPLVDPAGERVRG